MMGHGRVFQSTSAAIVACAWLAVSPASAQGVKIGVLNDQSGPYADFGGKWSVEAAKMAIEDFGGTVLGREDRVDRPPITRTSPISPPQSRAAGTTPRALT